RGRDRPAVDRGGQPGPIGVRGARSVRRPAPGRAATGVRLRTALLRRRDARPAGDRGRVGDAAATASRATPRRTRGAASLEAVTARARPDRARGRLLNLDVAGRSLRAVWLTARSGVSVRPFF